MVRFGNDDNFSLRNWMILLEEHRSMIHSWVLTQTPGGIFVVQSNYAHDVIYSLEKIHFPTDSYRVMMYWDEGEFDMNNTYWRKFLSAEKTDVYLLGGSFDREYRYPN
jgi:hypothetical protein